MSELALGDMRRRGCICPSSKPQNSPGGALERKSSVPFPAGTCIRAHAFFHNPPHFFSFCMSEGVRVMGPMNSSSSSSPSSSSSSSAAASMSFRGCHGVEEGEKERVRVNE
jgi:hypothetical protein